ncbi:MAG: hypothetical protein E5Y12_12905 [Mesorhizobium sp.]|nr:MAG: hypothetical protein E5Y12_12905 [Mesorhizobium sp.]
MARAGFQPAKNSSGRYENSFQPGSPIRKPTCSITLASVVFLISSEIFVFARAAGMNNSSSLYLLRNSATADNSGALYADIYDAVSRPLRRSLG